MQATLFANDRIDPQTRFDFGDGIEVRLIPDVVHVDTRKTLLVFKGRGRANGRKITYGGPEAFDRALVFAADFNNRQERLRGDYRVSVELGYYADPAKDVVVRPVAKAETPKSEPAVEPKVEPAVEAPKAEPKPAPVKAPAGIGYATSNHVRIPNASPIRDTAAAILLEVGSGDARRQIWFPKRVVGVTTDPAVGVTFYVSRSWLASERLGDIAR